MSFEILKSTLISGIMTTPPVTINADEDFSKVQIIFKERQVTHLIVVDSANHLLGIISQKYLYKTQSPRKIIGDGIDYRADMVIDGDSFYEKETLDSFILRRIMKPDPLSLKMTHSVADAVKAMAGRNLSCIPVVDDGKKVRGVVFEKDLILFVANQL